MPSTSLGQWQTVRSDALNEIDHAHAAVGGTKPGRRYATQQLNQAYAMLLASQFQGFCRDLHTECVERLVYSIQPLSLRPVMRAELTTNRQLDRGNAHPGSLGADFGRLGIEFWREVEGHDPRNVRRKTLLEELNQWRNAIAHQHFDPSKLQGATTVQLVQVRRWRRACDGLAHSFDEVLRHHLEALTGSTPW